MSLNEIIKYEDLQERVITYVTKRQDTEMPTICQLALQFKVKQTVMLQLVEDTEDLIYNIGIQIMSVGTYEYRSIGDYAVETI